MAETRIAHRCGIAVERAGSGVFLLAPQWVDRNANQVMGNPGRSPTAETRAFHQQLIVGDLHADSALWGKDLLRRNDVGAGRSAAPD